MPPPTPGTFQQERPPPQSNREIQPLPALRLPPKWPNDHRDSVSSWQISAKLKRKAPPPGTVDIGHGLQARISSYLGCPPGGQSLPALPPLLSAGLSADIHQSPVVTRRQGWGLCPPQLMKSSEITQSRQGSPGCSRVSPTGAEWGKSFSPKDIKQLPCPAQISSGPGDGGGCLVPRLLQGAGG